MVNRRMLGALLAALALSGAAEAQDYPVKPVTLIVPWPAGGSTDIAMRAIAEAAAKHLGQPIVIDNKPGASGTLGPGGDGGQRQARRLHHRADADHGDAPAADAEDDLGCAQGLHLHRRT